MRKEKIEIKKLKKYFFFDTKSIESIRKDMHAACLIGPIPITTIQYGYAIKREKYLLFNVEQK